MQAAGSPARARCFSCRSPRASPPRSGPGAAFLFCSAPPPAPPGRGFTGVALPITIAGTGFAAGVSTDFQHGNASAIDTTFHLRLETGGGLTVSLDKGHWVDANTLTAEVPASAARGLYDLVVT